VENFTIHSFFAVAGGMLSSSNYLQSAFESLDLTATDAERKTEVYRTFDRLCKGNQDGRGRAPAAHISINDLGDRYYSINKATPYYLTAQIVDIKHPEDGKASKEISTDNVARLKLFLSKRVNPGGRRVAGGSKEVLKYNRMVVFRY
jgi:hypothetical protein